MSLDQTIVTALITAAAIVILQGFAKKFFEKGSIVDSGKCGENRDNCLKERTNELTKIFDRLDKGEKIFTRMALASKIQAMALIQLCKTVKDDNGNLSENVKELDDYIKGRGDFKE